MKPGSKILIVGGGLLLLFGVFMDTSVDSYFGDITNASLVARQMMYLMLGGIAVIAGILLYGIDRQKREPEDVAREAEDEQRRSARFEQEMEQARAKGAEAGARLNARLRDEWPLRLTAGVAAGLWIGVVVGAIWLGVGVVMFLASIVYVFSVSDARRARARLFLVALIVAVLAAWWSLSIAAHVLPIHFWSFGMVILLFRLFGWPLVALVGWFFAYRWARREARYVSAQEPST